MNRRGCCVCGLKGKRENLAWKIEKSVLKDPSDGRGAIRKSSFADPKIPRTPKMLIVC